MMLGTALLATAMAWETKGTDWETGIEAPAGSYHGGQAITHNEHPEIADDALQFVDQFEARQHGRLHRCRRAGLTDFTHLVVDELSHLPDVLVRLFALRGEGVFLVEDAHLDDTAFGCHGRLQICLVQARQQRLETVADLTVAVLGLPVALLERRQPGAKGLEFLLRGLERGQSFA